MPSDLSNLQVLGSAAYVHIPQNDRGKLDSKSYKAVLVGYDDKSKGYRVWNRNTQKLVVT
jgi:hypothetical protein